MKSLLLLASLPFIALLSCGNGNGSNTQGTTPPGPDSLANTSDTLRFTSGIRSILHDSKGNYWIGSDDEGVCKYDGKLFTHYSTDDGLSGMQVTSIQEDKRGTIWLGTNKGVCRYNGKGFDAIWQDPMIPGTDAPWTLWPDELWFANGADFIRIVNGQVIHHRNPLRAGGKPVDQGWGATGFSMGPSGHLWISHYDGVMGFDGTRWTYLNDSTQHYNGKDAYMHVRSILEDSRQRLWIGNNGIGLLLKEGDSIVEFSKKRGLVKGEIFKTQSPPGTLMHVFAIYEDKEGNIWFGDRDTGAWRYDGTEMKNFIIDPSLQTQHVWQISEDRSGHLLFCMGAGGVYAFDGTAFEKVF